MARIDDSLAHGYAYNVLREASDEAARAIADIKIVVVEAGGDQPVNERRADRMVAAVCKRLSGISLWHHYHKSKHNTLRTMSGAMAVWYVPLMASRQGMEINRLIMFMEKRHEPQVMNAKGMTINPHVMARLFQRDALKSRLEVLQVFRPLATHWGLVRVLAHRMGHRQWGLPVADDALVIGDVHPRKGSEKTPDAWEITAKTYIRPLSAKWTRYRDVVQATVEQIRKKNGLYLESIAFDMLGTSDYEEDSRAFARAFDHPDFQWLRLTHEND